MKKFIIRRFLFLIVSVFAATLIVFALSRFQGDPRNVLLNVGYVSPEQWEAWGKDFHLDKPLIVQYLIWIGKGIFQGDFGTSLKTSKPVLEMVLGFAPASLQLGLSATLFVLLTGIPLGVLSAVKRGTIWDVIGRTFAVFGQALPPFWLGIMLILLFSVQLGWLPAGGREEGRSIILPAITLGWFAAAALLRLTRSAMLEVLDSEYVKLARAKGVPETMIIWKHAFRNAITVPLTFAGLFLTALLTGAVVTETVFAWPGLGRLAVQSVFGTDFPVMSAIVLFATAGYLLMNLLVDILYGILDPRIRHS